jgi:hypothetical protein
MLPKNNSPTADRFPMCITRLKGLARSGNARVRRGMIQLAWRFLVFQKDGTLAQWFRARTENARGARKTMIVALGAQVANCPVAPGDHRRGHGWRIASTVKRRTRTSLRGS